MIVRLVRDWKSPDILYQQTPKSDGVWNGIKFTFEPIDECDLLIVFTRPPYDIKVKCPKGNVWLLSGEPPTPAHRWHKRAYRFFDRIYTQHKRTLGPNHFHSQGCVPWQIKKTYTGLMSLPCDSAKKADSVSFISSNLNWMPGHEMRLNLIEYFKAKKFEFELFGRGIQYVEDKFDALYPYKYSIAIENVSHVDYWTEKIADCFLSWTMPIYYGAPNIFDYFPEKSLIWIDPKKPHQVLQTIRKAIEERYWEKNIDAIAQARELVLNKYQFFPFICNEIEKHANKDFMNKQEVYIPYNPAPWDEGVNADVAYHESNLRKVEYHIRKWTNKKPY